MSNDSRIITGDIVKVRYSKTRNFQDVTFDVTPKKSTDVFCMRCPFFCPITEGDFIICAAKIESETEIYIIQRHPKIIIGNNMDCIEGCLYRCFHKLKNKKNKITSLIHLLVKVLKSTNITDPIGKLIDDYLMSMAVKFMYDSGNEKECREIFLFFDSVLSVQETKMLLFYWFDKRILRRLYLLGLTLTDIRNSDRQAIELFDSLVKNPLKEISISLSKCLTIAEIHDLEVSPEERELAILARYIYTMCKNNGWSYLNEDQVLKEFPNFLDKIDLLESYGIIMKPGLQSDDGSLSESNQVMLRSIQEDHQRISHFINKKILRHEDKFFPAIFYKGLSPDQIEAVDLALSRGFSMILGPGGSGKTTILRSLISFVPQNEAIGIFSFTGKAVSRIREIMSVQGIPDNVIIMTVHQYLHKKPETPLKYVFIDEISMLNIPLFSKFLCLIEAKNLNVQLCLLGDQFQLEPIEWPGLLKSILRCDDLRRTQKVLTNIHRTSDTEENGVFQNGQNIRNDILELNDYENFIMIPGTIKDVKNQLKSILDSGIGIENIVILCPYNKYLNDLNGIVRNFVHRSSPSDQRNTDSSRGRESDQEPLDPWLPKDRVMLTRNNYDIDVMNGDEGLVTSVNADEVTVKFKTSEFKFPVKEPEYKDELKDLINYDTFGDLNCKHIIHSFALSIHKSQGSEWPIVIIYIPNEINEDFLNVKLVYTAITRARKGIIVIGNIEKFKGALRRKSINGRYLNFEL